MALLIKNNAYSTLNGNISNVSSTLTVASTSDADKFPVATMGSGSTGDYFYATLVDNSNNIEIIKVKTRASGSATMSDIQRAQDGSTARAWDANDRIELRPVAALFSTYIQADGTVANATNAVLADESSDTTCFPVFSTAATGNQPLKTGSNLTFNSDTGALGATSFTGNGAALTGVDSIPPGVIVPYGGTSAPSGWVFCNGQAVTQGSDGSTYYALHAAIGTTYGSGSGGSGDFSIPDLRGRVAAGKDDMGGSSANRLTDPGNTIGHGINGDTLGDTGGAETHEVTVLQMPAHTHTVLGSLSSPNSGTAISMTNREQNSSVGNAASSVGSSHAHNNVQPTIVLNYIIKL